MHKTTNDSHQFIFNYIPMNPDTSLKRNIIVWALYDFANSVLFITFFLYFAQWIVIEKQIPDLWFNLTFTSVAIALIGTAPFFGQLLDKYGKQLIALRIASVSMVIAYSLCALFAVRDNAILALICFALALYTYFLSLIFYSPLLFYISTEKNRGRVSGVGMAANFFGQISGLLIALPFATGQIAFFNGSARTEVLFPAIVIFLLLSIPLLMIFQIPASNMHNHVLAEKNVKWHQPIKQLFATAGIVPFFLAYFFSNGAILTLSNNFPIFLESVWHINDATKSYILLTILSASIIGSLLFGWISDILGHKRMLYWLMFGWVIIIPTSAMLHNFFFYVISVIIFGFWFGATSTTFRSLMVFLAPARQPNLAFVFFGLTERVAPLFGPVVWGLFVTNFPTLGPDRYRYAAVIMTGFILIGFLILHRARFQINNTFYRS